MKRIFLILTTFLCVEAFAQQKPQYTQYIFNQYLLNPALSGIENYIDFKGGYRKQWSGITDAPQTSFVSAHWALGDNQLWSNALTSFPEQSGDPMDRSYTQNYMSSPSHHGMGVTAVLDKTGPIKRLDANVTYAYHLQLSNNFNLSAGIAAGISSISLDVNELTFDTPYDPALNRALVNQVKPDLSVGLWLYGARMFAGLSVQQILPQKLSFTGDNTFNQGKEVPHFFATTGYKFFVDEEIAIIPSVMVKYVQPSPVSVDLNAKLAFKDKVWLGGSYRKNDSFSAMAGFNIGKMVNLTYSYDFTTSDLNQVSNGSHEIVLGLLLNNIYKVPSYIKIW
ncbi:PorP/SprF family type IX secretion system membrane protein [Pedobacter rhizosphaerae]|uniref:Type IX secretion system membrane protein, PorP/SprF family n=1 Tax=Pedobacter rhizosphaerae TaxID=390241 RepID=A0A1H9P9A1_9SPHI|nr:type IX secretion system membrane protein PorP/SprF [Pedobacter rhizosphaerae]SER44691.1 type IX secretion system membrane protein, PorP/SprF family [Pedobacter rhizosphaerae]